MKINLPVSGRAVDVPISANILSTTDLKGAVSYVNPDFVAISGFAPEELLGHNHNRVRHPDMPPAAFAHLWQTLQAGRSWMGLVKNRCKNGDHYWVSAFVTPILRNGKVIEYQSVRTRAHAAAIAAAEQLYARLRGGARLRRPRLKLLPRLLGGLLLAQGCGSLLALGVPSAAPAGALLALLLGGAWTAHQLRPLGALLAHARAIADNPLSQRLYSGRDDEFGELDFAMRMLEAETGAVVGRMAEAARQLAEHAAQLADSVASGNAGTRRQQTETEQVASAMQQLALSVQDVARNAQQSAEAAQYSDRVALSGQAEAQATHSRLGELENDVHQASTAVEQLHSHSEGISQMLHVIEEVAAQTNLLALNAAIEAARAGESGRGFAVVADEVRALASRTAASAQDIHSLVGDLQRGASDSVRALRRCCEQVRDSLDQAGRAAHTLEQIGGQVSTIQRMSLEIAGAIEEQSSASEEIGRSLLAIRESADGNALSAGDSQASSSHVALLAGDLRCLAGSFWEGRRR